MVMGINPNTIPDNNGSTTSTLLDDGRLLCQPQSLSLHIYGTALKRILLPDFGKPSIIFGACTRIETNRRSSVSICGGTEKLCSLVGLSLFQELLETRP